MNTTRATRGRTGAGHRRELFPPTSARSKSSSVRRFPTCCRWRVRWPAVRSNWVRRTSISSRPGAFTGEVAVSMLLDVGCRYVIVGHSERRHVLGETNDVIRRKVAAAIAGGLDVIFCVGELLVGARGGSRPRPCSIRRWQAG